MRKSFALNWLAVAFGAALTVEALTGAAAAVPDYITAAIADSHRPAEDTTQDANRKPAAVLALAAVKPGDTVIDLMPGVGHYTRCSA